MSGYIDFILEEKERRKALREGKIEDELRKLRETYESKKRVADEIVEWALKGLRGV